MSHIKYLERSVPSGRQQIETLFRYRSTRWATIATIGAAGGTSSLAVGLGLKGVIGAAFALLMFSIACIDARRFIIPNELNAAALALAILYAAICNPQEMTEAIAFALIRGCALAGVFFGVRELYRRVRYREGLGLGDVKLAAVAGTWLEFANQPIAVEVAALTALVYYGAQNLLTGRPFRQTARIPFGLFFAPAIWLVWLLQSIP